MSNIVLGGGLSGLSAAYYLLKKLPNKPIAIIEKSDRLGGWIKSNILNDGIIFEQGPRTIRPSGTPGINTLTLIDDLGLSNQVVPILSSHPAARNRMIYANQELHSLPSSIFSIFKKQTPFSKPLIRYLVQDLFSPKKTINDESIYDFVNRRFGREFADYLISALICGICAGNSKEISVNFIMKKLFEYEQQYGSISKGLIRNLLKKQNVNVDLKGLPLQAKKERWSVYSFKNGLETLPKYLESYVRKNNVNVELDSKCNNLEICDNSIMLHFENGKHLKADHVISSLPSESLANILQNQHSHLSDLLRNIQNVTVGVVNLCYNEKLISKEGFGFLVPPKEKLPILGVIYDSCCFPKANNTVLTVMMGGYWFEQLFGKHPEEGVLLQTAKEQLKNTLGISRNQLILRSTFFTSVFLSMLLDIMKI
ncbi:hypothetical protein NQ314_016636 [Rhamnusium bicolor]|uniref:Protoporphyrinogen oxidase n=1 Tax=Rhamnusium bicolor TaxID=1586634 RepID=A0AAV8WWE7_9CUCU|nr:hypothetical protein NQ314_016636 [Rhamnusium bicolor]